MTARIRRILVAVGEMGSTARGEMRKIATLALASGASVELFHAITDPDPGVGFPDTVTAETVKERRAAVLRKHERRLERLARNASLRKVPVTRTVAWDHPPHEAVIRQARKTRADLVVAATREHRFGERLLLRNTDWELIRHCPVPVLLLKSHRAWHRPAVLAAVDPFHAHARPADLDTRLLQAGGSLATLLRGRLHVFHAYMPLISVEPAPLSGAPMAMLPPEVQALHERQVARAIDRLAATAGIPRRRRHVCMGEVSGELQVLTRRIRAGLLVMGAVSRSALKRFFIGNTAERVLDRLDCDVLVVKPRRFKSEVSPRPRIAPIPTRRASGTSATPRSRIMSAADATLPPP
jgi:universal stress protein E